MKIKMKFLFVAAINKGRYSHEKRANNILEAKRIQEADIRRKEEAGAEAHLKFEMEQITQRLTDVYVNDFLYTKETLEKVPQFEQWYLVSLFLFKTYFFFDPFVW